MSLSSLTFFPDCCTIAKNCSAALREAIAKAEEELAGNGRVLIRPSGTEPLIRVMVEAGKSDTAETVTAFLTETVENLQKFLSK